MKLLPTVFLLFFSFQYLVLAEEAYETSKSRVWGKRMANRFFIRNTLIEIFGDTAKVKEIIDANYMKGGKSVGGPCDIYEQVYHDNNKVLDPLTECHGGKGAAKYPLFPETNILRTSLLTKTCHELIWSNPLPPHFQKISFSSLLDTISENFYPYGGDEKLKELIKKKYKDPSKEAEKEILLTYCLSPGWQRL